MFQAGERIQAQWGKAVFLASFCLCLVWCATSAASVPAGTPPSTAEGAIIPDHYIVVLKDSVARPGVVADRQTENEGGDLGLVYRHALKGYSAELSKDAVAELRLNPLVDYIVPDRKIEVTAQTAPTGVSRIHATENSSLAIDGKENLEVDADVAIIDTGIDYEHPDLHVVMRTDCVPSGESLAEGTYAECKDGSGSDLHGHGTHVAGTAGALDNGEGVVGVAPGARLWAVRALNREGSGAESWIAAAVDWVTAHSSQIEVANMSIGCGCSLPVLEEAIEASSEAGVVYTVAAGNSASDAKEFSPAKNPDAITVSAINVPDPNTDGLKPQACTTGTENQLASFSNYGKDVDVAAPGTCVYSTLPDDGYGYLQGTSMAAPHVAGAAAVLASAHNPEDLEDVESIREEIEEAGSSGWTDTSGDGVKEPLLDVGSSTVFPAKGPTAITQPAIVSSASKATLRGAINPGGVPTEYRFEYGTSTAYGTSVPIPAKAIGSGNSHVVVEEPLEGLAGKTLYHYRVVAINSKGTSYGLDRQFGTTPATASIETPTVHANDATLRASINPQGLETTYQFQYGTTTNYGQKKPLVPKSIGSGTSGVNVGETIGLLTGDKTYHYRLVIKSPAGTVYGSDQTLKTSTPDWISQTAPSGGYDAHGLTDVSCLSQSDCMAVGWARDYPAMESPPFAVHWSGKEWSALSVPNPVGKGKAARLTGVSCASSDWCVAAGYALDGSTKLFIAQWDGTKWSLASIPSLQVANLTYLPDVDCASRESCMVVATTTTAHGVAVYWNGNEWSVQSVTEPPTTKWSFLASVSCSSTTSCVAVGKYQTESKKFTNAGPLAVQWEGHEWSVIQDDVPGVAKGTSNGLFGVSCAAADACTAMYGGGMRAERWNGENWTLESVAEPAGIEPESEHSDNPDISCSTKSSCMTAGYYWETTGSYLLTDASVAPRAAIWDGSAWLSQSASNPTQDVEPNGALAYLEGISCVSPSSCVAVGTDAPDGFFGPQFSLIERYRAPGPISETKPATSVTVDAATLVGSVNPRGSATSYYFEYGKTTSYGTKIPLTAKEIGSGSEDVSASQAISSLEPGAAYHYRVVASSAAGTTYGEDRVVVTDKMPKATTEGASPVKSTEATLNAAVNPEGSATSYYFEYGKTTSYGTQIPTSPKEVGSGSEDVYVSQTVTGLTTGSTYHFRVVAEKAGVKTYGADKVVTPGSQPPQATTEPALTIKASSAALIGLVNPQGWATSYYFEYGKTTSYGTQIPLTAKEIGSGTTNLGVEEIVTGLASGTTYHFRVIAENAGGKTYGEDKTFVTLKPPKATTEAATSITQTTATVNATVNPEGYATSYYFEYGQSTAPYEFKRPLTPKEIGSGAENVGVSEALSFLAAGYTYHYRVVASSTAGTTYGEDKTFTTNYEPPKATTESALTIKASSAALIGLVNPRGSATSYYFEYGKTTSYGTQIPLTAKEIGSGTTNLGVEEIVTGLASGTTYHFRVIAENAGGKTYGEDKTFVTLKPPKATTEAASGIKDTEAALNGTVNPEGSATSYYFEYGKTPSYGTKIPVSPKSVGSETGNVAVKETITGLEAGVTYHYRLVAVSAAATTNGGTVTVTTTGPPKADTQPAGGLKTNGATVNGKVNPRGYATSYYFEYGATTSYGTKIPIVAKEVGAGTSDLHVSAAITGLEAGAVYHFRVVAVNSAGTTKGEDRTLLTRELPTEPAAFWSLDGEELEVGKGNAVDFIGYGELSFDFLYTFHNGPCEVEFEGSVWNGSETGEGSIESPILASPCKANTTCTITGVTPSSGGSWPLTATQDEVHVGGDLEFSIQYSGSCGLAPSLSVAGVFSGDFESESSCIELWKKDGLELLPIGYPVTVDGEVCLEAEGGLLSLE